MPPRKKNLTDQLRDLKERTRRWVDALFPVPEPELIPIPVRRPSQNPSR